MDEFLLNCDFTKKHMVKVFSIKREYAYSEYRGAGKDECFYHERFLCNRVYHNKEIITEQKYPIFSTFLPININYYDQSYAYAKMEGYAYEKTSYDENKSSTISRKLGLKILKSKYFEKIDENLKKDVFDLLNNLYEREGGKNSYYKTFMQFYEYIKKKEYLGGTYHDEYLTKETLKLYPDVKFDIVDINNEDFINQIVDFIESFEQVNSQTLKTILQNSRILIAKDFKDNIIATAAIKPVKNRIEYINSVLNNACFLEETVDGYTFKRDNYRIDGEIGYCNIIDNYRGIGIMDFMIKFLLCSNDESKLDHYCTKDLFLQGRKFFATTGNPAMMKILTRLGFRKVGNDWIGNYNPSLSLYILEYDFLLKNSTESN